MGNFCGVPIPVCQEYHKNGHLLHRIWRVNGKLHRNNDKPAWVTYYTTGEVKYQLWCQNDNIHRENNAAVIGYQTNGVIKYKSWYKNGKCHRTNAPAIICYNSEGQIMRNEWWQSDKRIPNWELHNIYYFYLSTAISPITEKGIINIMAEYCY